MKEGAGVKACFEGGGPGCQNVAALHLACLAVDRNLRAEALDIESSFET